MLEIDPLEPDVVPVYPVDPEPEPPVQPTKPEVDPDDSGNETGGQGKPEGESPTSDLGFQSEVRPLLYIGTCSRSN